MAAIGSIVRLDPAFDALVPKDAKVEKLRGRLHLHRRARCGVPSDALWFSDVVGNVVRQWTPDGKVTGDPARPAATTEQLAGRTASTVRTA